MGIKDYLKYLKHEYINDIIEYDHVYIDCNYLIHFLIYKCKNDKDLYYKINVFWENLISSIKIKSTVQLVYDGEYDTVQMSNPKLQTHILRYKNKVESNDYDKQTIKPGSKILNTFKYYLVDIIEKQKKITKSKFQILMNGDDIKGEADIKILNSIYNSNQDNICICSKDSDMILIAHSLSINKSIRIDVITNFRPIQIVYINNFKKYNLDYVLLVILLGNDYLPKISNITYESIINTYEKYIKYNKPIISNNTVNYDNLIEFITFFIIVGTKKKIKFSFGNFDPNRFDIYMNNLIWCLGYYKVINNNLKYIQEIKNNNGENDENNDNDDTSTDNNIKLKHTINIFNFINNGYNFI
jgi:hypothetical protein